MQAHEDTLLILNEGKLSGPKFQSEAVMMLDEGRAKSRFGVVNNHRTALTVISTSNQPLTEQATEDGGDGAVQVRMPSLDVASRRFGILDHPGENGAAAAIATINDTIRSNYGWAARRFIAKVTARRSNGDADLLREIAAAMARFDQAAGFAQLPPQQQRVCKTFGFIYATGVLAAHCGAIPMTLQEVGPATLSVFREVTAGMVPSSDTLIGQFEAVLRSRRPNVVDADAATDPNRLDVLARLQKTRSNVLELLVTTGSCALQLGLSKPTLGALREAGALVIDGRHFTTTRTGLPGRVHVVRLDGGRYPSELRVLRI